MADTNKNILFSVRGLVKIFPNGHTGISGIDLDIEKGKCLLMAGSNGSGKTIFMRMLAGLMDVTAGTILFNNKPLSQWGNQLRQNIGEEKENLKLGYFV